MLTCYLLAASMLPAPVSDDSMATRALPCYVGAQAGYYRFAGLGQTDLDGRQLAYRGLAPVVGYHVNRYSAVEISAMWRRPTNGPMTTVDYPNGGIYRYYDSYRSWAVPILFRYSMLHHARRWGLEGVVGFSVIHNYIEGRRSMTEPGQALQPFEVGGSTEANDLPLALGAAVTYTPTPHWTLVGEGRLNWSLFGSAVAAALVGGVFLPQTGASVGLRYNFGFGK